METTETKTPMPLPRRFRIAPLAWIGLTTGIGGFWLGRVIGDEVGWSQFSLQGALTQIVAAILVALTGVLTINFFLVSRTPPAEETGHRRDEAGR
jgi:hypothetical protein